MSSLDRARRVASALACAVVASTALLGAQVSSRIDAVLDENWRGSYDLLVTAPGDRFDAAGTDGLVDPNFVSTAGDAAISLDQVEAVRRIPGVEVAAPVGMVGLLRSVGQGAAVWIDDVAGAEPLLARLTMTVTADVAGSGAVDLVRNTGIVTLGGLGGADGTSSTDVRAIGDPIGFGPTVIGDGAYLGLGQLPELGATVLAVDPVAEAALRGDAADFLRPLADAPSERDLDEEAWSDLVDPETYSAAWGELLDAESSGRGVTAVPLVVREATTPVEMTVDVELAEPALAAGLWADGEVDGQELQDAAQDASLRPWTRITTDVSGLGSPFATPDLVALWPGATREGDGAVAFSLPATTLAPVAVGRPSYAPVPPAPPAVIGPGGDPAPPSYAVEPLGLVAADGPRRTRRASSSTAPTRPSASCGPTAR